jgi:hypothetical protein
MADDQLVPFENQHGNHKGEQGRHHPQESEMACSIKGSPYITQAEQSE